MPPGYLVTGVRFSYETRSSSTDTPSFISQIRLAQVQDPPATALVLLDDGTDLTAPGPVCADSAAPAEPIYPAAGALLLALRVNFASTDDRIVVRGVALDLVPDPESLLLTHTHEYLTGRGTGHNNTVAETSGAVEAPAE